MVERLKKRSLLALVACLGLGIWSSHAQNPRDPFSKWRPTRELAGVRYVGSDTCLQCHKGLAEKRFANPMSRALETVARCDILKRNQRLSFRNGSYKYEIVRDGDRSTYTISEGVNSISEPILYCFGQGKAGQTYVFRHNGVYYESRVSYYDAIESLDFTILHPRSTPASLEDGLGRPMTAEAAQGCFGCHSTAAVSGGQLQIDHLMPGVTCEGCHGPGEKHSTAIKAQANNLQIFSPAKMEADELTQEFCGACHVSFEKALLMPNQGGANNLRYQPYRIFNSPGHSGDRRISCVACHDPHDKLSEDTAFYDAKCLTCHLAAATDKRTAARSAPACPVSRKECTTCHMPKLELPGAHGKFTDHWIRVVRPGAPVPR